MLFRSIFAMMAMICIGELLSIVSHVTYIVWRSNDHIFVCMQKRLRASACRLADAQLWAIRVLSTGTFGVLNSDNIDTFSPQVVCIDASDSHRIKRKWDTGGGEELRGEIARHFPRGEHVQVHEDRIQYDNNILRIPITTPRCAYLPTMWPVKLSVLRENAHLFTPMGVDVNTGKGQDTDTTLTFVFLDRDLHRVLPLFHESVMARTHHVDIVLRFHANGIINQTTATPVSVVERTGEWDKHANIWNVLVCTKKPKMGSGYYDDDLDEYDITPENIDDQLVYVRMISPNILQTINLVVTHAITERMNWIDSLFD